ncbi:hypothetical protein, partial [Pseudoalteromonas sp. 3D05]|uniref:hypothetical protein n=1 Tax=Pseudoalteromonas sp. 3D05 TaxID=2045444 RepID=UPI001F17027C
LRSAPWLQIRETRYSNVTGFLLSERKCSSDPHSVNLYTVAWVEYLTPTDKKTRRALQSPVSHY